MVGAVSAGFGATSDTEFKEMQDKCYDKIDFKSCEKLCDLDDGKGCNILGILYLKGQGVGKDLSKTIKLYEKACDLKYANACGNLGGLYYSGQGIKQNKNKAKEFLDKACDLGDSMSCDNYKKMVNSAPTTSSSEETLTSIKKRAIEKWCDKIGNADPRCGEWAKKGWYDPSQRIEREMLRKMEDIERQMQMDNIQRQQRQIYGY
ncbi:tetratricopeptide repeat protein [Campylobacter troglodytis]|uniref:tetratricopeptide repeat protein n=1 Tax=Campylobacter troglodytis TaxID=654363 RepID=UPI001C8D23BA|nr:tetratricopeptide repeat protein [Campylobacter troglodytis]TQR61419.1 hypothetical protein DMC01_01280 [Campylobacter troglodytis]